MGVEGKQVSTRSETSPEVIVVGGGVIGTAIAYAFARRGISCLVLERGIIGQGTSEASAGIVSPPSTSAIPAERLELARRSFQAYPWLVAAVQEDSGLDAGYRQWGELLVAETEDEVIPLRELAAWQASAGFESEWVDGKTAREIEPLLPERIHGALLADEGGSLIVQRLVRALALAAASRGAPAPSGRVRIMPEDQSRDMSSLWSYSYRLAHSPLRTVSGDRIERCGNSP